MVKSEGQKLIEAIEAWLSSYLVFPNEHYAILAALWALNTWVFEAFDACPYLAITAASKRAGKTTLLELLSFLSRNAERIGVATRTDTLYSVMAARNGQCTLLFDEAERMSAGTASTMRAMMNAGYRVGEFVWRKVEGKLVQMGCFGPKGFALIGDPTDTLRDRSILFVMVRAISPKPYRPSTAAREAEGIKAAILRYFAPIANLPVVAPEWATNRDQEIMEPLWSLAIAMGCDAATLARVRRAGEFCIAGKDAEIRRHVELEAVTEGETYGERAIRDLWAVMDQPSKVLTGDIHSVEAVRRMRALSGTWENYKGEGLTEGKLADLVGVFGVRTSVVRMVRGRAGKALNGYSRKSVQASVPKVD